MGEGGAYTIDPVLRARLTALFDEGWEIWERFDREVRARRWHPFIPADYEIVLEALLRLRRPGLRFLEWGSATGVITIMADLLGFDACGIEIDRDLVRIARELADRTGSAARFAAGSFLPTGYVWKAPDGDSRTGTIGHAPSGYLELGRALEDFDLVFGYPWDGEVPMMLDLMRRYGGRDSLLLINRPHGVDVFRAGRPLNRIA
jgi:hypothetical protein